VLELPTDELPVSFRGLHRSEAGPTGNLQVIAPTRRTATAAAEEAAAENSGTDATPTLSHEEAAAAAERAAALAAKEEVEAAAAAEKAAEAQRQWILKYAQKTTQEEADREAAAAAAAAAGRASENAAEAERADRFALSLKNPAKKLAALSSRLKQAEGEAARLAALCGNSGGATQATGAGGGGGQKGNATAKAKKVGIEWGEGSQAAQLDGRAAAAAAARRVSELQKHVYAATTQVKRAASREQSERARLAQVQAVRAAAAAAAASGGGAAPKGKDGKKDPAPSAAPAGQSSATNAGAATGEGDKEGNNNDEHKEVSVIVDEGGEDENEEEGDMFGALSNTLGHDPLETSSRVTSHQASSQPASSAATATEASPPGPKVDKCKHPKCFFLRPLNPPKYATAADKAYCCIACKAAKKNDDEPSHGPACERRLVGDVDSDGSASSGAQGLGNSSGTNTGASGVSVPKPSGAATWSGKTPKELLEEWCRKSSRPPPLFSQPSQVGANNAPRKGGGGVGSHWVCTVHPAGAAHAPKSKKGRGKPQTKATAAAAASAAAAATATATAAAEAAAAAAANCSGAEEAWTPPKPSEAVVVEYDVASEGELLEGGTALYAAATKALYRFDRCVSPAHATTISWHSNSAVL